MICVRIVLTALSDGLEFIFHSRPRMANDTFRIFFLVVNFHRNPKLYEFTVQGKASSFFLSCFSSCLNHFTHTSTRRNFQPRKINVSWQKQKFEINYSRETSFPGIAHPRRHRGRDFRGRKFTVRTGQESRVLPTNCPWVLTLAVILHRYITNSQYDPTISINENQ